MINSFSKYFCMTGWRVGWMVVPENLVRAVERLQGNLAISVPTLAQVAAQAAFDGKAEMEAVKHGYEENRRILDGRPAESRARQISCRSTAPSISTPTSRASPTTASISPSACSNEAGVAATPGIDFDPIDGHNFLRFCYAGSAAEMHEAVERIGDLAQALIEKRFSAARSISMPSPGSGRNFDAALVVLDRRFDDRLAEGMFRTVEFKQRLARHMTQRHRRQHGDQLQRGRKPDRRAPHMRHVTHAER